MSGWLWHQQHLNQVFVLILIPESGLGFRITYTAPISEQAMNRRVPPSGVYHLGDELDSTGVSCIDLTTASIRAIPWMVGKIVPSEDTSTAIRNPSVQLTKALDHLGLNGHSMGIDDHQTSMNGWQPTQFDPALLQDLRDIVQLQSLDCMLQMTLDHIDGPRTIDAVQ